MNKAIKQGFRLSMWALVFTCTACSKFGENPSAGKTDSSNEILQQAQETVAKGPSVGETLDQQVSGAIADLAARTNVATGTISIKQARVVEWGSGALGCPKEGMNYTQAIVPGVLVILESAGVSYRYHGRSGSRLSYCPDDRAQEPTYGPGKEFM